MISTVLFLECLPHKHVLLVQRIAFAQGALSGNRPAAHLSACRLQTKKGAFLTVLHQYSAANAAELLPLVVKQRRWGRQWSVGAK